METERGHMSVRRGVSWSPGGVRKPLQGRQDSDTSSRESNASWERRDNRGVKGQPALTSGTSLGRKTSLTRSASLSEKELKEARVRSQIIAAQLNVPSNCNSRGVQLFNRRRQRVNAFTLESCGEGAGDNPAENEKDGPPLNIVTWEEKGSEGQTDRELNRKNSATKPPWSPVGIAYKASDIMEDPSEPIYEVVDAVDGVIQERHFLPVNEKEEEQEEEEEEKEARKRDEVHGELQGEEKDEITPECHNTSPVQLNPGPEEVGINGSYTEPVPPGDLPNGCPSAQGPGRVSVSLSRQTPTITNRTARPFFSPPTVQGSEARSPVMDIPPAPSYSTPPLPTFTGPRPVAFSPPPPPPSYPTPPLPAFTSPPPQAFSSPPQMSPVVSSLAAPVSQYIPPAAPPAVSQYIPPNPPLVSQYVPPPVSQYIPPNPPPASLYVPPKVSQYVPQTAPRPATFVPQFIEERKSQAPIKTGILDDGVVKRGTRKSMFTFKEKVVVAPNPELLSLVQGADERKKHGHRSVPELASEEELLALGAEASNFLAKEEVRAEAATVPEWSSCLKSSSTRARAEHKPEQALTNATGKGAELFAKRQSRMEKYVLENQNVGQMRSPSPTMSLPPSWVYPSSMPGRVKAIANNSNISAELSRTLKTSQPVHRKPSQPPAPPPPPESPPLENGCTKIEMELSRHQPYQLNSSLFILNPIKDPISSLPRGAPPPKPVVSSQAYSRQSSLPTNPPPQFSSQARFRPAPSLSPQVPLSPAGGVGSVDYPPHDRAAPGTREPFSPERVASPRSGYQAPRPTFSAKKAGIEPQTRKESPPTPTPTPTPTLTQIPTQTRTPQFTRRFSSPEGPASGIWSPSLHTTQPSSTTSSSTFTSRPLHPPTATSPLSPPWGSRCQSPIVNQTTHPSSTPRPQHPSTATSPLSPPWETRCQSPIVSNQDSKANHRLLAKNIINAAKRKNSPSPGALSGHSHPISPLGGSTQVYEHGKPPFSPFQSRSLGAQSPPFTSPPSTPTRLIRSPVRLYNTRSLTDSDASVESEDSGLRSPGVRTYNTCPRAWGGSLRVKRGSVSTDL